MQKKYINQILQQPLLIIIWLTIFLLPGKKSFCQHPQYDTRPWDSILSLYRSGKISDTAYQNRAFQLHFKYDKSPHLKELLETYREIAFSKKEYAKYRRNYYAILANNAIWQVNDGARIFYLEKAEEEEKTLPNYFPTLSSAMAEITFLYGVNNFKLVIEKSKNQLPYIEKLSQLILTNNIYYTTVDNAIIILKLTQDSYQKIKDTASSNKIFSLAKTIFDAVPKSRAKYNDMTISMNRWDHLNMQYKRDKFLGDYKNAEANLRLIQKECERAKSLGYQWGEYGKLNSDAEMFYIFLEQKKLDSAAKYLEYYKEDNFKINKSVVYDENYFEYSSSLMKEKGDYQKALNDLESAYKLKDSITNSRISDNKNNLYAQTEAEYNRTELEKSEKQKRQRNLLIVAISAILGFGIFFLYTLLQRNKRTAQKNIEQLNFASQLQITELEERSRLAKQEEQQRLGLELHDDLAGKIAYIKTKIEIEILESKDEQTQDRLKSISTQVTEAYERTRNKSHEWYNLTNNESESSFKNRIQTLLDNGLSDRRYRKNILIDDDALKNIGLDIKIEMLYVIQEAIINILKHAKANKVDILIYKDTPGLILQIIDNGKGFDPNTSKKGIGLKSIENRVGRLNGSLSITTGKIGTEINVVIPID